MALPKHISPGALTRKEFGYTPPSHEELIEEMEYIAEEMGGTLSVLYCSDPYRTWKRVEIIYDKKEKNE
tara:strand:- start:2867 stop:3073 length:207 start_codon:yes stop_codon:yes gene_type:complete